MAKVKASLVEGPIMKSLLTLSIPIIGVNLLQTAYQLTDAFWVGRLGAAEVAAVSVSFPINFLLIALGSGLAVAGSILVAQFAGAGNREKVNRVAAQTLLMVLIVSTVLSITAYILSPLILGLVGVGPDIFHDANQFQRITFLGLVFTFSFIMFQSTMRGIGEVRLPLYINLCTVTLNFFLDPLLIFGWGPFPANGVAGAAYATLATQILSTIAGFTVLFSGRSGIHLKWEYLKPDWKQIQYSFKLGLPASIEQSARGLGLTVMTGLVSGFGTFTLAVYGVGSRILSFVIIPALGVSMACSALVGQNIGAGNVKRAAEIARLAAWMSFGILSGVGVLFFAFAPAIVGFFIPDDPAVIREGTVYLRAMALTFGFIGVQQAFIGVFRGSGNTVVSMMLSIIGVWLLQFPLALFLSRNTALGFRGIWFAFPVSNTLSAMLAMLWFRKGSWQNKKLIEPLQTRVTNETIIEEGTTE